MLLTASPQVVPTKSSADSKNVYEPACQSPERRWMVERFCNGDDMELSERRRMPEEYSHYRSGIGAMWCGREWEKLEKHFLDYIPA